MKAEFEAEEGPAGGSKAKAEIDEMGARLKKTRNRENSGPI